MSGSSRKRGNGDDEDSSTLSSSRAEELEEEIDRVTRENMALVKENEKLLSLLAGKTGRNTYSAELVNQDQAVPRHLDLPKLSELLKMRQNPADNDNEDDPENNKEHQKL